MLDLFYIEIGHSKWTRYIIKTRLRMFIYKTYIFNEKKN